MNIAEQVMVGKQDLDEVKQAGYIKGEEVGRTVGYNFGWEQGLQQGLKDGRQAEYDAHWDQLQKNGAESGAMYTYAFAYGRYNDTTYNPKYPIYIQSSTDGAKQAYYNSGLSDTKVPIYCKARQFNQVFNRNENNLKIIRYIEFVPEATFYIPFQGCDSLESITVGGTIGQNGLSFQWSPNLDKASHISIINTLSATTSGLTLTLSKTAVNKAFETSKGAKDGSTSDEWTALIATKPNWTITLA